MLHALINFTCAQREKEKKLTLVGNSNGDTLFMVIDPTTITA